MKKSKPFINCFIYIGGIVFFTILATLFNINPDNLVLNSAEYITVLFVLYWINRSEINDMFKDYKKNCFKYIKKTIWIWLIGFGLMMLSNYLISSGNAIPDNEKAVRDAIKDNIIIMFIITSFLAPFIEEIVFRLGFNVIKNKYLFYIITSLIFGLVHITSASEILYIISYALLGLSFAICYKRTNNIWTSMTMHMLHNIVVFIGVFIF